MTTSGLPGRSLPGFLVPAAIGVATTPAIGDSAFGWSSAGVGGQNPEAVGTAASTFGWSDGGTGEGPQQPNFVQGHADQVMVGANSDGTTTISAAPTDGNHLWMLFGGPIDPTIMVIDTTYWDLVGVVDTNPYTNGQGNTNYRAVYHHLVGPGESATIPLGHNHDTITITTYALIVEYTGMTPVIEQLNPTWSDMTSGSATGFALPSQVPNVGVAKLLIAAYEDIPNYTGALPSGWTSRANWNQGGTRQNFTIGDQIVSVPDGTTSFNGNTSGAGSETAWHTFSVVIGSILNPDGIAHSSFGWSDDAAGHYDAGTMTGELHSTFGWTDAAAAGEDVTGTGGSAFGWQPAGTGWGEALGPAAVTFGWTDISVGYAGDMTGEAASVFGWSDAAAAIMEIDSVGVSNVTFGFSDAASGEFVVASGNPTFGWSDAATGLAALLPTGTAASAFGWQDSATGTSYVNAAGTLASAFGWSDAGIGIGGPTPQPVRRDQRVWDFYFAKRGAYYGWPWGEGHPTDDR